MCGLSDVKRVIHAATLLLFILTGHLQTHGAEV